MRLIVAVQLALVAVPAMADYASDLLATLNSAGLTTLATTIGNVASTNEGKGLVSLLSMTDKNFTVFAPTNDGFSAAFPNGLDGVSGQAVAETLQYHVVSGALGSAIVDFPATTIGRTYLNASDLVKLEGNKAQVVAWSKFNDSSVYVLNQPAKTKVVKQTSWNNLNINVVDHVLTAPGSLADTLKANNLTVIAAVLKQVPGLFDALNTGARGFTLFAPNDAALKAATGNATIAKLLANQTILANVLANHVVNGTTVYSPQVGAGAVSAAGEKISAQKNNTGVFLSSGPSTVQVVQPDVLLRNGVVHIIDGVFLNADSNPSVASSAFQSATSAAGTAPSSTETAPIGASMTGSQTGSGSGSNASPTTGSSGAVTLGFSKSTVVVSVIGALTGGFLTLF